MGLLNAQVARYYGADVIISELFENKLKTAKKLGFSKIINPRKDNIEEKIKEFLNEEEKIDDIIIAVGATSAYNQAIQIAPKGCRFLIFAAGYPVPGWTLEPNMVHYNLWEIIGTYGCSTKDYEEAATLLSKRDINTETLIEAKYPLKDIQKAFEKAATPGTYRTAITISEK
jgi:L-iditol 2-dehydrogenase